MRPQARAERGTLESESLVLPEESDLEGCKRVTWGTPVFPIQLGGCWSGLRSETDPPGISQDYI